MSIPSPPGPARDVGSTESPEPDNRDPAYRPRVALHGGSLRASPSGLGASICAQRRAVEPRGTVGAESMGEELEILNTHARRW